MMEQTELHLGTCRACGSFTSAVRQWVNDDYLAISISSIEIRQYHQGALHKIT